MSKFTTDQILENRAAARAKAAEVAKALNAEVREFLFDGQPETAIKFMFSRGAARVEAWYYPDFNEMRFERTGYHRGQGARYTKVARLPENVSKRLDLADQRAKSQTEYFARRDAEKQVQGVLDGWVKELDDNSAGELTATAHPVIDSDGSVSFRIDARYVRGTFSMNARIRYGVDQLALFASAAKAAAEALRPL